MAQVNIRVGSAADVFSYDDGDFDSAIETTATIKSGTPVDPTDVTRLEDIEGRVLNPLVVTTLANPTELNSVNGVLGALIMAYEQLGATVLNEYTLYAYDASGPAVDSPYVVDAGGTGDERWIAVGGLYSIYMRDHATDTDAHHSEDHTVDSHTDTNLATISNNDLLRWDDPSSKWLPKSVQEVIDGQDITPGQVITNSKSMMTPLGGFAIRLTNKTGANSVAGQLVDVDTANNDAVVLTGLSSTECIGVIYESGIADGSEVWIVVAGIADVMFEDNYGPSTGDWIETSGSDVGTAYSQASPAASPEHFREIGHCIETVAAGGAGTFVNARCVLHFN